MNIPIKERKNPHALPQQQHQQKIKTKNNKTKTLPTHTQNLGTLYVKWAFRKLYTISEMNGVLDHDTAL